MLQGRQAFINFVNKMFGPSIVATLCWYEEEYLIIVYPEELDNWFTNLLEGWRSVPWPPANEA